MGVANMKANQLARNGDALPAHNGTGMSPNMANVPTTAGHMGSGSISAATPNSAMPNMAGMSHGGAYQHQGTHQQQQQQQQQPPVGSGRFPIQKQLPESLQAIPTAVAHSGSMGAGRPTLTSGGAALGGVMGQPVIQRTPQVNFESDGDHVLSKKKLDELVRQVTGGGSDAQEHMMTPDVEEVRPGCVFLCAVDLTTRDGYLTAYRTCSD